MTLLLLFITPKLLLWYYDKLTGFENAQRLKNPCEAIGYIFFFLNQSIIAVNK